MKTSRRHWARSFASTGADTALSFLLEFPRKGTKNGQLARSQLTLEVTGSPCWRSQGPHTGSHRVPMLEVNVTLCL